MSVKKGDILTRKAGGKVMVLETLGDVVFMSAYNDFKKALSSIYHQDEIAEYFIIPKEKWVPEVEKVYWFVDLSLSEGVDCVIYSHSRWDKARFANNAAYPTKKEALAAYEKCKAAMAV